MHTQFLTLEHHLWLVFQKLYFILKAFFLFYNYKHFFQTAPSQVIQRITETLGTNSSFSCNATTNMPSIYFTIGDREFEITPNEYVFKVTFYKTNQNF